MDGLFEGFNLEWKDLHFCVLTGLRPSGQTVCCKLFYASGQKAVVV